MKTSSSHTDADLRQSGESGGGTGGVLGKRVLSGLITPVISLVMNILFHPTLRQNTLIPPLAFRNECKLWGGGGWLLSYYTN